MITVKALKEWLATLSDDSEVGIDEGGLELVSDDQVGRLEVGGFPISCECGREFHLCQSAYNGGAKHGDL
jgi:hypothetical protein